MTDVIRIVPKSTGTSDEFHRATVAENVIDRLESAVERAQNGCIDEVLIVEVLGDQMTYSHSGTSSVTRLVGMLEYLKLGIMREP